MIETFGDVNVDGTGETWEYTDSWAYKLGNEWTYGAVNCTNGSSIFSESTCPYPICDDVVISGCMDNGLELNGVGELADYDGDGMPAFNYNPNATEENGTCITVTYGCTNQLADNYDSGANTNDGSCTFESPNPLFFSEYAEGSSNNKYLEIFNSGSDTVDLADYAYPSVSNAPTTIGQYEYWNTFDEGATIAPGGVYVIAHPSSDPAILAFANETHSYLSNGDDGYALAMGTEENHVYIDWIGDFNGDPGSQFSVCEDGDTKDNTLVRNCDVTVGAEWSVSSSAESCQWTVLPNNTWDDLGSHTSCVGVDPCASVVCEDGFECVDGDCIEIVEPVGCDAPTDWNVIVTGSNHTIVIPSESIVTLADGNVLDHANVGVFYTNDDGNLACAGSAEITPGETVQIAAMGDDTTTPELDGLVSGADLVWMIADCYGNVFAANATYAAGPEIFTINGITTVSAITEAPSGPSEQELSFATGWSMFSTYMIPADLDLANLLSPIVDQVIIAKDYLGAAYLPEWNFNGIGDLTLGQGYQIKTTETTGVTVTGDYAMPQDNPINLTVGWNMVAYLRLEPAAADAAFADINATGNLIIAKDYLGAAYLPEWNFNGIGDLNPGQAYQLKVNNADVLQYLSNDDSYRMSATEVTENNVSHYAKVAATDNNMTVVIEDAAWDVLPTEGSEIAAFDKDGNMVGSAIYSSPVTVVTVWGDDATTTSKDGMLVSESVSFKVWNTNEVSDFKVAKWIEGSSSYQVDGISVASTIETNNVITELNASERVLVKVINVLGQEVNLDDEPFKGTVLFNVYDDGSVERFIE